MSPEVRGFTAPGFEVVRDVFVDNFVHGVEVGASFSAVLHGELVVDLWGGYRDARGQAPWQADSVVNVYSTTKGLAAAALAVLVDDGLLDFDAPVRTYWPELAAAQTGLTVTQLLSHQAGLSGVSETLAVQDLYDWAGMCRRLERQAPWWTPGTAAGYHAVTWSYLAGELARRVGGVSLARLLRERLSEPLGADVWIGLPMAEQSRAAELIGPNRARPADGLEMEQVRASAAEGRPDRSALYVAAMENPLIRPYADACSAPWRAAELAASNGHANARGIATIYGALAGGGALGDMRVLSADTVERLREEVWGRDVDLVLGYPMRRGRGVNLNTAGELGPNSGAFGHSGTGGSVGFADPDRRLGVGYAMNQLWGGSGPGSRSGRLIEALYGVL